MSSPAVYENIKIIQQIGQGYSAVVQLVQRSGELVALKVFKEKQLELFENEKRIMQLLDGIQGVVKYRESINNSIMMDYAKQGNMLEYLQSHKINHQQARKFFMQLIKIVQNIHLKGVAHRDLKLENILLDERFDLLLCDFGFASVFIDDKGKRIKINNFVGTPQTAAPELYLRQPYYPAEADLFQLGVILFQLCSGTSPFGQASQTDKAYNLIYKNQCKMFWSAHKLDFSEDLKHLIEKLLSFNPNQRLSIDEILMHPWMQH
ncbi:hypothetical protein pb186bvf_011573 [Paramecium bursaria]